MKPPITKTADFFSYQSSKGKWTILAIIFLTFLFFHVSIGQQLIFVDELERLPDSSPSANITAQVLPNSGGKILYGQIGNQNVRWVDGKPEKLDFPGRILETNGDFSYVKGVITNNQRYYVFKDGEYHYIDIALASGFSSITVEYFSDDGKLIIGTGRKSARSRAVRIVNGNWEVIGADPPTTEFFNSGVAAVRGQDGSIIVGYEPMSSGGIRSYIYENGTFHYFSHQSTTYARVASKNGKVVAGHASDNTFKEFVPFKWQGGQMTILGHFGAGFGYTFSTSVNNEGTIVSGYAEQVDGGRYLGNLAFIWMEGKGMIKYVDFLSNEYGITLPGERITQADFSEDQTYINGTIRLADNTQRSFILLLEESDERLIVNSTDDRPLNASTSTDCNTGRTVEINGKEVPECTFRAALQAAINRHAEEEDKSTDISFNIPGEGIKTITLLSPLPEITIPIEIDGTSQRTNFGLPLISLDGSVTAGSGLVLKHDDIVVKGMAIHGFSEHGIFIENIKGIVLETLIVGTDANRTPHLGNGGDGIHILGDAKVKIGGNTRGISPLETPDFGTNVAILGNAGRGIFIHNPANGTNERKKPVGYYQAEWEERNSRVKEEEKNIEVANATFGMLKFENVEAYTDPNIMESIELLGAKGFTLDNASFWDKDSPSVSVIASEAVHVVQATFGKKSAVVSSPDDVNSNVQRGANSSIKVRGSRGITIGSYDPAVEPVEGVAAGSWFLEIEDSEDVEVHNVIAGAVKNLGSITQNTVAAIRNLEGGISIRNSQKIRIGRKGLPTIIANNGGKNGSPGAGIRISGNLSQVIKIAALQIGALDGGIIGGNEGDGILLEEGVANFEIGGEEEEEAVIVAGNKGFGLVFSKINENTILAEYVGKEVGKVTNLLTDAISKARFEFPVPNQSGGVKVSNAANILFKKLSIGQTEGNGIELNGVLTKNIKILQSSIGSVGESLITASEKIKGPKGDGILIYEASEIEIGDGTEQGRVRIWGSSRKGISILSAEKIKILKAKIGAFDFSEFSSEFADAAQKSGNAMGGISITDSKRVNIFDTKISNNGDAPQSEFGGILVKAAEHIRIHGSEIGNRTPKGTLFGNRHHAVVLENAKDIALSANKVAGNIGGIFGTKSDLNLDGNTIGAQKSDGIRVGNGISFYGGMLKMIRNIVKENEAVGIHLNSVFGSAIRFNDIFDNFLGGIKSGSENDRLLEGGQVFAQENWWGDPSGPGGNGSGSGNEVSGNVDFDNWLTSPIGIIVTPESHLVGLDSDEELEISVAFANHLLATDRLNITLADSLGWMQGSASFSVDVSGDEKSFRSLSFKPSNSQSSTNKVTITAVSESNPDLESSSIIYMLAANRIVFLDKDELDGKDRLDLDRGNFRIGDELLINNGAANEEKIVIKDFGSIILEEPLKYSHAAGEGIILLNSTITSIGMEPQEITQPILGQNYPNPFSTLTQIPFTLPTSEKISLEIYDQMGRTISVLIDGTLNQGKHLVTWEPTGLPAGIYFYKIQGTKFSETKKMILKR